MTSPIPGRTAQPAERIPAGSIRALWGVKEAAAYLSVSTSTVKDEIAAGHLVAVKHPFKNRILIRAEDLDDYITLITTPQFWPRVVPDVDVHGPAAKVAEQRRRPRAVTG